MSMRGIRNTLNILFSATPLIWLLEQLERENPFGFPLVSGSHAIEERNSEDFRNEQKEEKHFSCRIMIKAIQCINRL